MMVVFDCKTGQVVTPYQVQSILREDVSYKAIGGELEFDVSSQGVLHLVSDTGVYFPLKSNRFRKQERCRFDLREIFDQILRKLSKSDLTSTERLVILITIDVMMDIFHTDLKGITHNEENVQY